MLKVHHLNCGTIHTNTPYPGVSHCLLLEGDKALTLVDTGFGINDYIHPSRHVRRFTRISGVPCDVRETALNQVKATGFEPQDVRHIVMTHLHLDHAGGIADFSWAQVHVFRNEYVSALKTRRFSLVDRIGYVDEHLRADINWMLHSFTGFKWFGFDAIPVLEQPSYEVFIVPLAGHSRGHCAVAVQLEEGWLLHCGDAYIRDMQIDIDEPKNPFPIGLRTISGVLFPPGPIARLRALRREHGEVIKMFCSHDRASYAELRGISLDEHIMRPKTGEI
ncbi:MAG: MBL fold metallo-hydrolase [Anaerolineales bacterium]|jgi:glyoxylase-like metal-dependent hydrolase (beta-lactamase superfamily II)